MKKLLIIIVLISVLTTSVYAGPNDKDKHKRRKPSRNTTIETSKVRPGYVPRRTTGNIHPFYCSDEFYTDYGDLKKRCRKRRK